MKHVRQFTAVSDAPRALRMTQNFCDWLLVQNQFMLIRRRTYRFHNRINAISQLNWLATVNRISVNFAAICSGEVGIAIGHWPPWHFTSSAFQKRFPNGIRTKTCDNDLSVAPLTFGQLLRIGLKIDCNHSFRLSICHKLFVYFFIVWHPSSSWRKHEIAIHWKWPQIFVWKRSCNRFVSDDCDSVDGEEDALCCVPLDNGLDEFQINYKIFEQKPHVMRLKHFTVMWHVCKRLESKQ